RLDRSLRIVLAVIGRNDAEFAVAATGVTAGVDERHVPIGLIDASRWTFARHTDRLARHHGIVLVRPHVELLHLVPELRLVHRAIHVAEPGRRVELEVVGLVVLSRGIGTLRWSPAPSAAGHV